MSAPFHERALEAPGLLDRLLRRPRRANALAEIETCLARSAEIRKVRGDDVEAIAARYDVDPARDLQEDLAALYRAFLAHCVRDRLLSDHEIDELAHLKNILHLSDRTIDRLHHEVAGAIYGEAVAAAIVDRRLDPEERDFLERLQTELRLSEEMVRRIHADRARLVVQRMVEDADRDERLSPEEDAELEVLARNLDIEIRFSDRRRARLDKFRYFWLIENGEIPEVETKVPLQRGERCFFETQSDWYETRRVTRRVRREAPTLRIKIGSGVYWRMGDLGVQRVNEDVMTFVDSGRLLITDRRLIFLGTNRDDAIRIPTVVDFTAYRNGVEIDRRAEKSVFLHFDGDVDLFAMILGRVIRDSR